MAKPVLAQQQESHYDPEKKYRLGYELFVKEKYSAARETFKEFLDDKNVLSVNTKINAEYYSALSGAELFHPDAENELVRFTQKYPESLKAKIAYFHAGNILYKQKNTNKPLITMKKQISVILLMRKFLNIISN